jgi:hypothetical protein
MKPIVPNGKGPHTVEMVQACLTPLPIGRQNHLSIGTAQESMPESAQLFPQFEVVVQLAVVDNPAGFICAGHWLVASGRKIQDGQSPVTQRQVKMLVKV